MKLSHAIMLGDSLKKSGDVWLCEMDEGQFTGCALAGAAIAAGLTQKMLWLSNPQEVTPVLNKQWPWLTEAVVIDISCQYSSVVAGHQSLEQLVDYVRSIEPESSDLMGVALLAAAEDTDPGDEVEALRQEENDAAREGLMQELGSEPDPASSRY